MSNQSRLHPSVLSQLKPYVAKESEYWRFSTYVDNLESKYLNRDLLLEENVKFLLALIPSGLSVTAKGHLCQRERNFLRVHSYEEVPASNETDTSILFWAPLCQAYFIYPEVEGLGEYPELTYAFYKQLVLQYVSGDFGVDNCLTTLKSLKQNNTDLRAHVGEFQNLLDRYCQLANIDKASAASLSLFTDFFYQSLDVELRESIQVFPQDLQEAFSVATDAARTNRKRKTLSTGSALPQQSGLKRTPTSSVNSLGQAYADSSVANLAQYFDCTKSDPEFLRTVTDVCSLTPNIANIAQASKLEVSGLRASVASVLRDCPSYRQACNAIQNLTPSKFVKRTSATRSEESHYENLDELSSKQIKALYQKRQLIENLRSRPGAALDSLSDEEEEAQPSRPATRSRRAKEGVVTALEHDCNIAFMDECFSIVDVCAAEALCSKCNNAGHFFRACPELKNADGTFAPFCAFCKGTHTIQTCAKLLSIVCHKCKSKGHTSRFCPSNACSKCSGPHHVSRCQRQ